MSEITSKKNSKFRDGLKHAFAVDDAPPLDEADLEFIDMIVRKIHRRGMSVPGAFFFHTIMPLTYISSQALVVLEPLLGPLFKEEDYKKAVKILSNRKGFRIFVDKLEAYRENNEQGS